MKRRLYLMLGRAGDVLNILPLCRRDFLATGQKPLLMVQQGFASLLDGISYVNVVPFLGKFEDVAGAYRIAEKIAQRAGAQVVCAQIYGEGLACGETCSSFMRESWAQVPGSPAWGSLPLVFDRREPAREAAVKQQLLSRSGGRPYVLLALSGTSSPFAYAAELSRHLRNELGGEFDFIDISAFMAPKFYDLIATFEDAHALVAIDAGPLHLAHAAPSLPVVAFITREPSMWHGSPWRPAHVGRFFYDEAPECFDAVARCVLTARDKDARPKIWHVWSQYAASGDAARRTALARQTWAEEAANGLWRDVPFTAGDQWRDSSDVGDARPMPYMADAISHVMANRPRQPSDIIAFTNADVCFTPGLTGWVLDAVRRHGATFTHRWDFTWRLTQPLVSEAAVKRGNWYPGSDAYFFTVEWWGQHGHEYPDMILGREQCDEVLRQLIKRHCGVEIPGAIYHEKHTSFWEGNRDNAGNKHNRRLARQWFMRNNYGANDWQWWNCAPKRY